MSYLYTNVNYELHATCIFNKRMCVHCTVLILCIPYTVVYMCTVYLCILYTCTVLYWCKHYTVFCCLSVHMVRCFLSKNHRKLWQLLQLWINNLLLLMFEAWPESKSYLIWRSLIAYSATCTITPLIQLNYNFTRSQGNHLSEYGTLLVLSPTGGSQFKRTVWPPIFIY